MLEERSQLFALSFLEEGLLIGSQGLFGDRLPAFGLLSNHLGTSFASKLLCRLVGGHAKLLTRSTIDLEDREASPSMSIGLLLSAILVEDVHRAVRCFTTVIRTGSKYCRSMGTSENLGCRLWNVEASHDDVEDNQL